MKTNAPELMFAPVRHCTSRAHESIILFVEDCFSG